MGRRKVPINLPTVEELFTSQEERDSSAISGVIPILIERIDPFPGHPFQVRDDEDMASLVESVQENGILVPLTVRDSGHERYELISGHRRKRAAELAGLESVPCIIRSLTDEEATIAMVDSNMQRETILPSERAFAYSMRLEAMKRQGQRTDLTCAQVAHKSDGRRSRDILAEELGISKDKVQRYIRLTHLIPQLLTLVDEGRMKMLPAVEISHLTREEQEALNDAIGAQAATPSHAQAIKMKKYSREGTLTPALIRSIMEEEKPNQVEQFKIPRKSLARFFRPDATRDEIERRIIRALELLDKAEKHRDGQGGV